MDYFIRFGFGNPVTYAGLSPTFTTFKLPNGTNVTPPAITEVGVTTGMYTFAWGGTTPIAFIADAATISPGSQGRYVSGDIQTDVGASIVASITIAIAGIGNTTSTFGTTSTDPGTLFGYMKRVQELLEGNAFFNKQSDVWAMYSRGSSTLLREKSLSSNALGATKI